MSDSIKKLSELFSQFPTVGKRTANRFVFHLIRMPKENTDELIKALQSLKTNIRLCNFCFQPFEGKETLCSICNSNSRNKQLLCIVEKETDLTAIEAKNSYKGLYFILGGNVSLMKNRQPDLRLNQLKERVKDPLKFGMPSAFTEVIMATNPTPEGIATSLLVEKALREVHAEIKITHLAKGLPMGGELEYADEETLGQAFEGRK